MVSQYSPLLEVEDAIVEQEEASLAVQCQGVLRRLPACVTTPLTRKDLRHAALHGSLRPHLFGQLSDEQLMELVKFMDYWELPQPWLRMAQAERGARAHPAVFQQTDGKPPLDAYSSEAATWALWTEVEPLLQSVRHALDNDACAMACADPHKIDAQQVWVILSACPTCPMVDKRDDDEATAIHVLCGARQPEFVLPVKARPAYPTTPLLNRLLAIAGDLEALQWARGHSCPWDEDTCAAAARGGHLDVLQWMRSQDPPCPWNTWTCSVAAEHGHLGVLQWLRANGCSWDENTSSYAARRGHLAVLQWLRSQDPPCPWDQQVCNEAARRGHLPTLQWLRSQDPPCPWDDWTCMHVSAVEGHLPILQWARSQDPPGPWSNFTCAVAANSGHRVVLQWLRASGCPWDELTCSEAALGGRLEVLQWAREHGCPWDARTCYYAARGGHLEVLQWAREHGCPWVKAQVCLAAGLHRAVLQWLSSDESDA